MNEWLTTFCANKVKLLTYQSYEGIIKNHIKPTIGAVELQAVKGGKYYIATSTKSGKPRTVEPPPIAFEYLRAERVKQLENRLKAGPIWSNPDDLVFTDESGKHYITNTFFKRFKRIVASIGRPDTRPHDLRHTAARMQGYYDSLTARG